jgi:hypothetical protein
MKIIDTTFSLFSASAVVFFSVLVWAHWMVQQKCCINRFGGGRLGVNEKTCRQKNHLIITDEILPLVLFVIACCYHEKHPLIPRLMNLSGEFVSVVA